MVPSAPAEGSGASLLQPEQLLAAHPSLATRALCVALSGGLDSTVLLHLLVQLRQRGLLAGASLRALHIHHGLQIAADDWLRHCRQLCNYWQVPFTVIHVSVQRERGESLEMAARQARYDAFAAALRHDELLLQAHHSDDQAETVLLRLLRGSGVRGLGAIPVARQLGPGCIVRPLLSFTRMQLWQYATANGLVWIDDPSNEDQQHDRNFLRATVLPQLASRWPAANVSLAHSAALLQEADTLLDELGMSDVASAAGSLPNRLSLPALRSLSRARLHNALRCWLRQQPPPLQGAQLSSALLQRCVDELVLPLDGEYRWLGWSQHRQEFRLHRYRDTLYLLQSLPAVPPAMDWSGAAPLSLPSPLGSLRWTGQMVPLQLRIEFRHGGERVNRADGRHQSLQHHWQQHGVPPWLRSHVPLLYHGDELVAIGDGIVPLSRLARAAENRTPLCWQRSHLLCGW